MKASTARLNRFKEGAPPPLSELLERKLVGQTQAITSIVPYVEMFQAGLSPESRPAGVFLLLGPTGTGKTRTVETLADALHGSEKNLVRIDCGEFQMEHEVAKLIGAPPGYLGHRETPPMLTQNKLSAATSDKCGLSILLFDEIEKAAASMTRLLLGILDKATLRLGDNTSVSFERTMIFLTSNVGASGLMKEIGQGFGFGGAVPKAGAAKHSRLDAIGQRAVRRKFSPEFINRIDSIITYQPLTASALEQILDLELAAVQRHLDKRLGERAFEIHVPARTRKALLEAGTSAEFGARELRRTLQRQLIQPIASLVSQGRVMPGSIVTMSVTSGPAGPSFRIDAEEEAAA